MARADALDLRKRVVAAIAAGESCRQIAATFRVSVASEVRWSQGAPSTASRSLCQMGPTRAILMRRSHNLGA